MEDVTSLFEFMTWLAAETEEGHLIGADEIYSKLDEVGKASLDYLTELKAKEENGEVIDENTISHFNHTLTNAIVFGTMAGFLKPAYETAVNYAATKVVLPNGRVIMAAMSEDGHCGPFVDYWELHSYAQEKGWVPGGDQSFVDFIKSL